MQRNAALGRRPQHDAKALPRAPGQTFPGAVEGLSLAQYRLASRWRALLWFWVAVLSTAMLGGMVLEMLGPPSDPALDLEAAQAAMAPAESVPPAAAPADLTTPAVVAPPTAAALARPESDAAPMSPPDAPLDLLAPADPASQGASPRGRALLVLHPARTEGSAAVASRLAARAGLDPDQIDVGTVGDARPGGDARPAGDARLGAVIRFYSENDHALARRLGQELGHMGYTWKLENFATRPWAWKDQAIEVFLPNK